jgi:hypothetical protein
LDLHEYGVKKYIEETQAPVTAPKPTNINASLFTPEVFEFLKAKGL